MAFVTPTNVTVGSVLTASKYNQEVVENVSVLPRGIVARESKTAADTTTTNKDLLSVTFTAVSGRLYRVDLIGLFSHTTSAQCGFSIKNGATEIQRGQNLIDGNPRTLSCVLFSTFTAGSVTLTGNMVTFGGGTLSVLGNSTFPYQLAVADIGLA